MLFSFKGYSSENNTFTYRVCKKLVTSFFVKDYIDYNTNRIIHEFAGNRHIIVNNYTSSQINEKKFKYPKEIIPGKDVFIGFDELGHASLSAGSKVFHGRVLTSPTTVRKINFDYHKYEYILKVEGLSSNEIKKVEDLINLQQNKRTLTCINGIEYILYNSLGLEFNAVRRRLGFHPNFLDMFTNGLKNQSGQLFKTSIFRFRHISVKNFTDKVNNVINVIVAASPLTIKSWAHLSLNPRDIIYFNKKNNNSYNTKALKWWGSLTKPAKIAWNWIYSTFHNAWGAYHIVKLMKFKPMKHGLISPSHPWITGFVDDSKEKIYQKNMAFASPKKENWINIPESDDKIVDRIGHFLGSMAKKSSGSEEIPHGPKRRMPHVVNYLHGSVSYNGVSLIFNDMRDAMIHLSDNNFIKDLYQLVKFEKREFFIILREREYREEDLAFFLGFIRSHLKWYANANGPKKKVLYGVTSPYPLINVINGSWVKDIKTLINKGEAEELVYPPLSTNYFEKTYHGNEETWNLADQALAYFNYLILKPRGFQAGMVFTPRKKIEPRQYEDFQKKLEKGEKPSTIAPIKNPFLK